MYNKTGIETTRPIKPLKKIQQPKDLIFFDTESWLNRIDDKTEKHSLRLGVLIYVRLDKDYKEEYREIYHFYSAIEFWDYVERKIKPNRKLWIFAHNAKYDFINVDFVEPLISKGFKIPPPIINHAFILTAKKNKKSLKLIDTFNYIKTSVKQMGKAVSIDKLEMDFTLGNEEIDDKKLLEYCEVDVKIITAFVIKLINVLNENNLGSLQNTTASTAFNIYRTSFIEETIYYHKNDKVLEIERNSYRGGMVECYHIGKLPEQTYYLLDVNSMYPFVMSNCELPVIPLGIVENDNLNDLKLFCKTHYVIADVLIRVSEKSIRRYGLKFEDDENGKRLLFPIGEYRISLHNSELLKAFENNEIIKVFSYVIYKKALCLKKYSDYFYYMKQNATNKSDYEIAKLFMNSLYGRFGMRHYKEDILDFTNIPDMEDFQPDYFTDINPDGKSSVFYKWGDIFVRSYAVENEHVNNTNIALAGAVTAYARMLLSEYIAIAGLENVFYMDTDSLVLTVKGFNNLSEKIDDKKLGYLKIEMIFNSGIIHAPKDYIFMNREELKMNSFQSSTNKILQNSRTFVILNKRERSKGIPNSAIVDNEGNYQFWRFTTIKEYMRSGGNLFGRELMTKKNSYNYHKGIKSKTGKVIPFTMGYDTENQMNYIKDDKHG